MATWQTLISGERIRKFDPSLYKIVIVDEAHHAAASSYLHILSHFNDAVQSSRRDTEESSPEPSSSSSAVNNNNVAIVGFSATFSRHDGLALGKVFQEMVFHKDFREMIQESWYANECWSAVVDHGTDFSFFGYRFRLCPLTLTVVRADLDLSGVMINRGTGDFTPSSLAAVLNTEIVNELVVRVWLDKAGGMPFAYA